MSRSRSVGTPVAIGVLLVVVVIAAGGALGLAGGRLPGPGSDDLVARPVNGDAPVAIKPDDPEAFVAALAGVDWELQLRGEREPTAGESQALLSYLGNRDQPLPGSMRVVTEIAPNGAVVIQFANGGGDDSRCQIVGRPDNGGLEFLWGHSCWDPAIAVFQQRDEPGFTFGCDAVLGWQRLGLRDFMAEIHFPANSPGAIITLAGGGTVAVRPTPDNYAIYAGPMADHIDVYGNDGEISTRRTADCA